MITVISLVVWTVLVHLAAYVVWHFPRRFNRYIVNDYALLFLIVGAIVIIGAINF